MPKLGQQSSRRLVGDDGKTLNCACFPMIFGPCFNIGGDTGGLVSSTTMAEQTKLCTTGHALKLAQSSVSSQSNGRLHRGS
mmetsp:Transcript_4073/g.5975  ORF Transcript_4073/g.5975 Transcript_4073/m.5975 type:complete len:81 (-) Transcript_4073:539-781(-)